MINVLIACPYFESNPYECWRAPSVVVEFVRDASVAILSSLTGEITMYLRPYRYDGQCLAADFRDDTGKTYIFTFSTGGRGLRKFSSSPHDTYVPDMTDALLVACMMAESLNAAVKFDYHPYPTKELDNGTSSKA